MRRADGYEVRLLWLDRELSDAEKFLPIDPKRDISQVMTSPHATLAQHKTITHELKRFGVVPLRSDILDDPRLPTPR